MKITVSDTVTKECKGKCVKCDSENLFYGSKEIIDEWVYYPYECQECSDKGKEWYEIKYLESETTSSITQKK